MDGSSEGMEKKEAWMNGMVHEPRALQRTVGNHWLHPSPPVQLKHGKVPTSWTGHGGKWGICG